MWERVQLQVNLPHPVQYYKDWELVYYWISYSYGRKQLMRLIAEGTYDHLGHLVREIQIIINDADSIEVIHHVKQNEWFKKFGSRLLAEIEARRRMALKEHNTNNNNNDKQEL